YVGAGAMKRIAIYVVLGSCAFFGGSASIPLSIGVPVSAQTRGPGLPPVPDVLLQLNDRFEAIARKVSAAVVSVEAIKPPKTNPVSGKAKPTEESGSGIIVQVDGRAGYLVLTNNHVVAQAKPEQITVQLSDGRIFRPGRVWADPETDIALL